MLIRSAIEPAVSSSRRAPPVRAHLRLEPQSQPASQLSSARQRSCPSRPRGGRSRLDAGSPAPSSSSHTGLPGDGERVGPDRADLLPKLRSSNSAPALQTAPGAHHWRLVLPEIAGHGGGDLVTLGDGSSAQTTLAQVPHDLVLDRVYVHGDPVKGQKRGIALNSASTTIANSYICPPSPEPGV